MKAGINSTSRSKSLAVRKWSIARQRCLLTQDALRFPRFSIMAECAAYDAEVRVDNVLTMASRSKILVVIPALTMLLALPFEFVVMWRPVQEMTVKELAVLSPFVGGLLASPGYLYAWGTQARALETAWKVRWWIRLSLIVAVASACAAYMNVMISIWPYPLLSLLSAVGTVILFVAFEKRPAADFSSG